MIYEYLRVYPNDPENYLDLNPHQITFKKYLLFGPKISLTKTIDRKYYLKSNLKEIEIKLNSKQFSIILFNGECVSYVKKEPGEK